MEFDLILYVGVWWFCTLSVLSVEPIIEDWSDADADADADAVASWREDQETRRDETYDRYRSSYRQGKVPRECLPPQLRYTPA
ncbi:hypothetical protein BCON_0036g00540 [Botryotinia convoluta]|uniref:Secreted protein n=1 Tax=Botryotinia convoluta TaxID=54673 RepID=A0A4Z1IU83_9HELO|nr:hypothetical protein BCON_0036g00540 [Botryotinia convoluta]